MRLISVLAACLLFQARASSGQPGVALSNENDPHEMAFQLREDHLLVIEGRIATLDKLKCLIDTGATHSVVSQRIAQSLRLPREPGRIFRFERYATVEWALFPEVEIGPISMRYVKLVVDSQPSDMPSDVDAIIGLDLLSKTSGFLINYSKKVISFSRVLPSGSKALTCLTTQVMIQGHPVNLVADTGMHGFLLYENLRQRFPDLKLKIEKTVRLGQLHAKQARVSGLRLGSSKSDATIYLIHRPAQGVPSDVDGYFGMDALNASLVEFDFENGRLRLN